MCPVAQSLAALEHKLDLLIVAVAADAVLVWLTKLSQPGPRSQ